MGFKKHLIAGAAALAVSTGAYATPINIGGVVWDPDSIVDFFAEATLAEQQVQLVGDTLSGFGKITSFNSLSGPNEAQFCPSCELTFEFGGYTLAQVNGNDFVFNGGWMKMYVDHTPDYNIATGFSSANDGVLFLDLQAVEYFEAAYGASGTLFGTLTAGSILSPAPDETGTGAGFFSVVGGIAGSNFDTNTFTNIQTTQGVTDADLSFSSSFQPNSAPVGLPLRGTGEMQGDTIPEPSSLALIGLGILGLGAQMRRRKAA